MAGLPEGAVTFLLTDVPGGAARWESAPDQTAAALERLDALVAATISRHRGHLVKPRGENDSHFMVFADPGDAVRAAMALGTSLADGAIADLRMAMTAGRADLRDGDYFGPVVNHCARLRAAAHGGQIVVGEPIAVVLSERLPDGAVLADLGFHWLEGLERPLRVYELRHPALRGGFPDLISLAPPAEAMLVPLTSFVGRVDELATVVGEMRSGRSVTITGAPGVGKSRLAVEVAAGLTRNGQARVRLPNLDRVEGALTASTDMPTVAILDDVDRGAQKVARAISARARNRDITVFATARSPLGYDDERVIRLSPLGAGEATQLLRARAADARPSLEIDADTPDVTTVLSVLSGLPLAIELAAARLSVLSIAQLAARLHDPGRVLAAPIREPAHHRSFSAAVAWTWDLLDEADQTALRALAKGGTIPPTTAADLIERGWAEPAGAGSTVLPLIAASLPESAT